MTEEISLPEAKKKSFRARILGSVWLRLAIVAVVVGLFVSAAGGAGYFYRAYQKTLAEKNSLLSKSGENKDAASEIETLVEAVSKLIELPTGETPTLATVSDKTKLEGQSFFKRAENGDKVLIYTNAGKAILYRPTLGKVIDMAAINTANPEAAGEVAGASTASAPQSVPSSSSEAIPMAGEGSATNQSTPTEETITSQETKKSEEMKPIESPLSVVVLNGTTTAGLAKAMGEKLKVEFPTLTVQKTGDAKKKGVEKPIVVDTKGARADEAKKVADFLGGEVGALPDRETPIESVDLMIIAGAVEK